MNSDFDFQKGLEELEWMSTTNGRKIDSTTGLIPRQFFFGLLDPLARSISPHAAAPITPRRYAQHLPHVPTPIFLAYFHTTTSYALPAWPGTLLPLRRAIQWHRNQRGLFVFFLRLPLLYSSAAPNSL